MSKDTEERLFHLGMLVITSNASATLNPEDVQRAIGRHRRCDWGNLCPEDMRENERALHTEGRLFSTYADRTGTKFYIITEADRSATTVLLPEDY